MYIVKLSVKPYLVKYLHKVWGTNPIVLNQGIPVHREISKSLQAFATTANYKKKHYELPHAIEISLSENMVKSKRFFINAQAERRINAMLTNMMYQEFCAYMNGIGKGEKAIGRIADFMKCYDMGEDEIKMETLKKCYQRYCRKFDIEKWAEQIAQF